MLHPLRHDRLQQDSADTDRLRAEIDDWIEFLDISRLMMGFKLAVLVGGRGEVPGGGVLHVLIRLFR